LLEFHFLAQASIYHGLWTAIDGLERPLLALPLHPLASCPATERPTWLVMGAAVFLEAQCHH